MSFEAEHPRCTFRFEVFSLMFLGATFVCLRQLEYHLLQDHAQSVIDLLHQGIPCIYALQPMLAD